MKFSNFIDWLNILKKYYKKIDGYHIGVEHDQFYAYETDFPITPEDVQKLLDLGWFQLELIQIDGGTVIDCGAAVGAEYNPKATWSAFI